MIIYVCPMKIQISLRTCTKVYFLMLHALFNNNSNDHNNANKMGIMSSVISLPNHSFTGQA